MKMCPHGEKQIIVQKTNLQIKKKNSKDPGILIERETSF